MEYSKSTTMPSEETKEKRTGGETQEREKEDGDGDGDAADMSESDQWKNSKELRKLTENKRFEAESKSKHFKRSETVTDDEMKC